MLKRITSWILLLAMLLSCFALADDAATAGCRHENLLYRMQNESYHSVYCIDCNEIIEAEDDHIFDNDMTCTLCSYAWTPRCEHFNTVYEMVDEEFHRVYCPDCKTTLEKAAPHDFANSRTCALCGYNPQPECDHVELEYISKDGNVHFVYCAVCKEFLNEAEHEFNPTVTNGPCEYCGYQPETGCNHANSYYFKKDENSHYIICMNCAQDVGEEEHIYGDDDFTCIYCGYERHLCLYSCKNPGVCMICGKPCTDGDGTVHGENEAVALEGNMHAFRCLDCNEIYGKAPHFQSCTKRGICDACGLEADPDSTLTLHDYTTVEGKENWEDQRNNKHAIRCFACNEIVGEELPHKYDKNERGGKCTVCGSRFEAHVCENLCTNPGKCIICGRTCTGAPAHGKPVQQPMDSKFHVAVCPDCGTIQDLKEHIRLCSSPDRCPDCGSYDVSGVDIRHNYDLGDRLNYIDLGNGKHDLLCLDCKAYANDPMHHIFSLAQESCTKCGFVPPEHECAYSCTAPYHCAVCGKDCFIGPVHSEKLELVDQGSKHAYVCPDCDAVMSSGLHVHSCKNPGICEECKLPLDSGVVAMNHRTKKENGADNWKAIDEKQHAIFCFDCEKPVEKTGNHIYSSTNSFSVCLTCHYTTYWHVCKYVCTKPGVCKDCGKAGEGELVHGESVLRDLKDGTHGKCCADCGKVLEASAHVQTCMNKGVCKECGAQVNAEETITSHFGAVGGVENWKKYDETSHAMRCAICFSLDMTTREPHSFENRICTKCNAEQMDVAGLIVPVSPVVLLVKQAMDLDAEVIGAAEKISYASSKPKVASVDANGVVTAKAAGTAEISIDAYGADGSHQSAKVTVIVKKLPTKISFPTKKIVAGVGDTFTPVPNIQPNGAYDEVRWTISDESKIIMDENGKFSCIGAGTAVISAETVNGKKARLDVTILAAPSDIELDTEELRLILKTSVVLKAKAVGEEGVKIKDTLSYSSSDPSVATVDAKGKVTAKKIGTATITISTCNGITKDVQVKVQRLPKKIELNLDRKITLNIGEGVQITPKVGEGEYDHFTFKSKNKNATVDETGYVTAVSVGTTTVTVWAGSYYVNVNVVVVDPSIPTGVELDKSGTVIAPLGKTLSLNTSVQPDTAVAQLKWTSSNKKVATVSANGLVFPLKVGTVTITVTTQNGLKDTVKVQIVDPLKPLIVELDKSGTVDMLMGETLQLNASILPETASNARLTWTSSNKKVATVNENGLVAALQKGTATISVKTSNGKTDTVKLRVLDPNVVDVVYCEIKTEQDYVLTGSVVVGEYSYVNCTVYPETAKTSYSYTSSNKNIATIDKDGRITALKPGTVTIKIKTANGKTASVKLKIVAQPAAE